MVWAAIIPAVASLAGAAIGAMGQSAANKSNRGIASAQMAFQDNQNDQAWDRNRDAATRSMEYDDWQRREQQAFQSASVNRQEDFQRETMATAMDYNTRMSNTSYQRGMADMKAAGLNPILAFGQGGATAPQTAAPSGASATGGRGSGTTGGSSSGAPGATARMENTLSGAVSGASQLGQLVLQLQQMSANIKQTEAATALTNEQQHQVRANTALNAAQAITEGFRPDQVRAQTRTEEGRPAALSASIARDVASAAQLRAQEQTERERPSQVREETRVATERANNVREHTNNMRAYGPPGPVSSTVGAADTIGRNIGRWIQELLQ